MGNSPSQDKNQAPATPIFQPDYTVVEKRTNDPYYGEIKLVTDNKTNQQMYLKEIAVNTKQAYEAELNFYKNRVAIAHPNMVTILGYTSEDKHNFCSTYYKISVFIEIPGQNLLNDLQAHQKNKAPYSENELLLIADNLISGLSYFQSQGHSHGDIRAFNIFAQEKVYKLTDPSLSAQKGSNALTLAIIQGASTNLAPELLKQVPDGQYEIKSNKYKADVFSLGITLLSSATLTNAEEFYNYKKGELNTPVIQERLSDVRSYYSEFTYDLIRDMLSPDEASRPDFIELEKRLAPFQKEIRSGSALPFAQHHVTGGYASHPKVGEVVKKSAAVVIEEPPQNVQVPQNNVSFDDLEARIKAAMERSEATFRAVASKDNAYYSSTSTPINIQPITSTYQVQSTPTHNIHSIPVTTTPQTFDVAVKRDSELAKSSGRPVETTPITYNTNLYTSAPVYAEYSPAYNPTYVPTTSYTYTQEQPAIVKPAEPERALRSSQPLPEATQLRSSQPLAEVTQQPVTNNVTLTSSGVVNPDYSSYKATNTYVPTSTYSYTPVSYNPTFSATPFTTDIKTVPATTTYEYTANYTPAIVRPTEGEKIVKSSSPVHQDYSYTYTSNVPATTTYTTYTVGGTNAPQQQSTQNPAEVSNHIDNLIKSTGVPSGYIEHMYSQGPGETTYNYTVTSNQDQGGPRQVVSDVHQFLSSSQAGQNNFGNLGNYGAFGNGVQIQGQPGNLQEVRHE